jgi:adenylylsulfate kinase-like enzyme
MQSTKKNVLVILPLTLPGCGKSSLISLMSAKLKSESCECSTISSEKIRMKVLEKYSTMPSEFAHKKSQGNYNREFVEELRKLEKEE